jgi:hypothetical protein
LVDHWCSSFCSSYYTANQAAALNVMADIFLPGHQ